MSEDAADSGNRWWLNPAIARLAFGNTTRSVASSPRTAHPDSLLPVSRIDLSDPEQRDFGDYELIEEIGQGGMGVVYRARQQALDRDVALKLLSAGQWASEPLVETLRAEAQHAARLQHPNIVVVYAIGEHAGLPYYSMQLVRGSSLSQYLDTHGPMPPRDATKLLRTIAEAVDYAHRLGVLHLDLKPGNVLLEADGTPRIADFGLARRLGHGLDEDSMSGTPSYMAPEQAIPGFAALSPATDVWALGAVLYEVLTGHPPFEAEDTERTLHLLRNGIVRQPSRLAPIPADLEATCLHCLQRDPAERYANARALADDLGRFLEGRSVSVRPLNAVQRCARWARREPRMALATALASLALLVGVVATSLQWRRAEGNALQAGRALAGQRAFVMQQAHALGRDFGAMPGLAENLRASEDKGDVEAAALERQRLGATFGAYPRLIDRFSLPQKLASLALSPDGRLLAIGTLETSEVMLFNTSDGRRMWQTSLADEPAFFGSGNFSRQMHRLRFSPDGKYLLVGNWWPTPVVSPSGMDNWRIDVANGALAHPQRLFPALVDATYSEDGRYALLRRMERHQVQLWDAQAWRPVSGLAAYNPKHPAWLIAPKARFIASWIDDGIDILDPRTLAKRVSIAAVEVTYTAWAVDPDARRLALGNGRGGIFMANPDTGQTRRLLPGPAARVEWIRFSGDGNWLVAGSQDGSVWLWQGADGFSAGRRLHIGTPVSDVQVDPASGLLRVGDQDAVGVWQLSGLGEADRAALPRAPLFRHSREIPRFGSDMHVASGLLASASIDGEVRLWRLPGTPLRSQTGPAQMTSRLAFDGVHYVAVDGRRVTVVQAADNRPATPAFLHPQSVGFAAMNDDGSLLVTTSGRELRVFDWRQGRLRFPPVLLPNSPMKLALQGRRAYATYTVDRGRPFTEAISAYSMDDGQSLGTPVEIPDGISTLLPTPDGHQLAVLTEAGVELFDAATLRPVNPGLRAAPGTQIVAIAASKLPRRIATAAAGAGADGIRIHDAHLRSLEFTPTAEPPVSVAFSADATMHVAFLPGNRVLQLRRDHSIRTIDAPSGTFFARSATFSDNGRMLAQALVDGVLLLDTRTGEWLAPPLRAPIPAPDVIAQVAFNPEGTRLLARTAFGRWLWWRIDAERRPVADIVSEARNLSPTRGAGVPASTQERRALRAMDPGPAPQALPTALAGSCLDPDPALPARVATTPARLLDLAVAPPAGINPHRHTLSPTTLGLANLCSLPLGVQRMAGVDFDIRAAVRPDPVTGDALYAQRAAGRSQGLAIASGIEVPAALGHAAAFEVLATSATFVQDPLPETLPVQANLVLRYADGSKARLPLRYGKDIMMWTQPPPAFSRLAWRLTLPRVESGNMMSKTVDLYRIRLANPHPDRRVLSLDIEALPVTWNGISVLAITVDSASVSRVTDRRPPASAITLPAATPRPPAGATATATR